VKLKITSQTTVNQGSSVGLSYLTADVISFFVMSPRDQKCLDTWQTCSINTQPKDFSISWKRRIQRDCWSSSGSLSCASEEMKFKPSKTAGNSSVLESRRKIPVIPLVGSVK
jgi:hypothetical protein